MLTFGDTRYADLGDAAWRRFLQNPFFVDNEDKRAKSHLLPAYLHRYPFITTAQNGEQGPMVCFDKAYGGFNTKDRAGLFEDSAPSETLQKQKVMLTFGDGSPKNLTDLSSRR